MRQRVLKDGSSVLVRPIRPSDKEELAAGLHRLSERSVQLRFLAPKPAFSETELRYLTEVDGHDHVAFVAERPERPGTIVAVARYVALGDAAGTAEAAIVVADPLQGLGLGTALADELARAAVRNGVRRFSATMLSENRAAHRLMRRLSAPLETRRGGSGQDELIVELAA
jgi:RimJ/RimL family protein N-acetyltransferase